MFSPCLLKYSIFPLCVGVLEISSQLVFHLGCMCRMHRVHDDKMLTEYAGNKGIKAKVVHISFKRMNEKINEKYEYGTL